MTALTATTRDATRADRTEADLLLRVLSALLREDVVGLRSATVLTQRPDGPWLRLPDGGGGALLLPVAPDGFQARYAARLPLLRREGPAGGDLTEVETVLRALAERADPQDRPGFADLARECHQTLATMRLHEASAPDVMARLAARQGLDPARWEGMRGSLALEALAARLDHPVYPTARGRAGLSEDEVARHAPEFHPAFPLRWVLLPREGVHLAPGADPADLGLPTAGDLGLDRHAGTHVALPVHPLCVGAPLANALAEAGLAERAVLAPRPAVEVLPTLSMRTVARADEPTRHLKLPLATSTLGLRNRRTIKPGTLVDGAAGQALVQAVLDRHGDLRERVLLADETRWAHAGHELLAVLARRYPAGLEGSVVVPLAGLLAPAPGGRLVIEHLADRYHGGDVLDLLDALLTLLFDLQVTLFTHGIALESHQQNVSLVLDEDRPPRLLLKDNDGPRVNRRRLAEHGLDADGFDDPRTAVEEDRPLVQVFATITVHLCAGAFAFGLARLGRAPLPQLLALVRDRLEEALRRPGAEDLRAHLLGAPELPVKAMVSAGTLLTRERSGAADVNKHYTTGPNYLAQVAR